MKPIIADSSPLIAFAILNQLELLTVLFSEIYLPPAVLMEISVWSKPYSQQLREFARDKVKPIENQQAVKLLAKDVDVGEAEAIVLALENGIENIFMDDFKGRKMAQLKGLSPIGTVGALLQAKRNGYLNQIKPSLDKLIVHQIRIGKSLYTQAIQLAGEDWPTLLD